MKVSIITIVYNNCSCIVDCLHSVQNQTYKNIEHIVIDGGSTDGTQQQIEAHCRCVSYYKSERDAGLYDALNKGILHATGDIVGVMHSDDLFYEPNTVQKIVDAFEKSNADIVYANGLYVDRNNPHKITRVYAAKPFRSRYLSYGWVPLHTTMYARRELFLKYGMYETQFDIAGDYEITLRWLTNKDIKTCYLNSNVVKMRMGGKSTSVNLQKKKSGEDLVIINKYKLNGFFTLAFKIGRKIPQYLVPRILNNSEEHLQTIMFYPRGKFYQLRDRFHAFRTGENKKMIDN